MAIDYNYLAREKSLIFKIEDKFDVHLLRQFEKIYKNEKREVDTYIFDLKNLQTIDSLTCSSIVLLCDYAAEKNRKVLIDQAHGMVKETLLLFNIEKIANFR